MSLVYLQRAAHDSQQRERWLDLSTEYANQAIAAAPLDELNHFNAARNFESAGDLSVTKKCPYYQRSAGLFHELSEGLGAGKKDAGKEEGPAVVLQKNAREGESRVKQKATAANCKEAAPGASG